MQNRRVIFVSVATVWVVAIVAAQWHLRGVAVVSAAVVLLVALVLVVVVRVAVV